jgi:glycosyltransferase involved in cell wall biosynthesis
MGLMSTDPAQSVPLELSLIAPAHNEQDNIIGLIEDVEAAMCGAGVSFEFIIIDDGSTDATAAKLAACRATRPWLRTFRMLNTPPGKGNGQSAAFFAGLRRARGELIALLDADRQNDPTDLPAMIRLLRERDADMVQGDRSANRRDTIVRIFSSWVGRTFRRTLLGDTIRDTGCSLRVFKRELGLQLPLQYKGMHRFIPVYARTLGYMVIETPVHHRPRIAGEAKYGIWNRALPGLRDLFAVRWMRTRLRPVQCEATDQSTES